MYHPSNIHVNKDEDLIEFVTLLNEELKEPIETKQIKKDIEKRDVQSLNCQKVGYS